MKLQTGLFILLILIALAVTVIHFLPDVIAETPNEIKKEEPQHKQPGNELIPKEESQAAVEPLLPSNDEPLLQDRELSGYSIEITKSNYQLQLFKGNALINSYNVALGNMAADKLEKDDPITPLGNFYIVSIENTSLRHPEAGPWFIRLHTGHFDTASGKAFSGIGIKGGAEAQMLGQSIQTDCIIMQNKDLIDLKGYIEHDYKHVRLPVFIRP